MQNPNPPSVGCTHRHHCSRASVVDRDSHLSTMTTDELDHEGIQTHEAELFDEFDDAHCREEGEQETLVGAGNSLTILENPRQLSTAPWVFRAWRHALPHHNYGQVVLASAVMGMLAAAPGHSFVMGIFTEVHVHFPQTCPHIRILNLVDPQSYSLLVLSVSRCGNLSRTALCHSHYRRILSVTLASHARWWRHVGHVPCSYLPQQ